MNSASQTSQKKPTRTTATKPRSNSSSSTTPDYFFVLDRDSAIARPGAKLAQDILNNEMVDRMRAKKNDRIVYLTPAAWYLAEGGVKAMDSMFADVEKALGLR